MRGDRPPDNRLPETLTRLLTAPRDAIWPTPEDRHRLRLGRERPRQPSRAVVGVWVWAVIFNVAGFAILAALWRTMG